MVEARDGVQNTRTDMLAKPNQSKSRNIHKQTSPSHTPNPHQHVHILGPPHFLTLINSYPLQHCHTITTSQQPVNFQFSHPLVPPSFLSFLTSQVPLPTCFLTFLTSQVPPFLTLSYCSTNY